MTAPVPDAGTDPARNPAYWPSPEWTVRCADGTWSASALDGEHAARIVQLFDAPDMDGDCGPHEVHRSDPSRAVAAAQAYQAGAGQ